MNTKLVRLCVLRESGSIRTFALAGVALLALLAGTNRSSFAQGGVGTITGTLTDPTGLTVPDASVLIHNTDTNLDRTLTTTEAGLYTATFLPSGHYEVTASKQGFAKQLRKDLTLQVGQTMTIDFAMAIQTAESVVTVTSEAPVIDTSRTEESQTVSETLAAGLPLNGRRWEQFVFLTPGVTNDGGNGLVSYHGISGLFNNSSVDGTNNQQAFFSESRGRTSVGYTYSLDSVKEFNVSSSSYSAEFGQAAGGQVNAVTKSGSNDFHGDLFYYLRYPTTNAFDPFSKASALSNGLTPAQPEHQRQQFGGSVGGAIKKDKLFYFVNYDGQRRSFPIIFTGPISSTNAPAAVTLAQTSETGATPCGALNGGKLTIIGITAAQCKAAVDDILGNIGPQPRKGNQDIYLGKLDYQATSNNHLSVSFNFMNWNAPNDYRTSPTFSAGSNSLNGSYGTHNRYLVANWNSIVSPTMVNDFRFQWSRDFEFYGPNFSGPSVAIGALFGYGMPNALPRLAFPDEHRLQFSDSVSVVRNKHTIKFGLDISPIHELLINLFQGGGVYSYNYSDTSVTTAAATLTAWIADVYHLPLSSDGTTLICGNSTALATDKCIGQHFNTFQQATDAINPASQAGKDDFYDVDYATYIQDSWKMRPNLTLNLGLRWDLQWIPQPPRPNPNTFANFYTNKINIPKLNFGPRFGIAWQATKNSLIRGGYGIFYAKTTNSLFYNTRVENGVYQVTISSCNAAFTPSSGTYSPTSQAGTNLLGCAPAFPNIFFPAPGPALQAPFAGAVVPQVLAPVVAPSAAVRGQAPDFLQPMVHEAEIGYERQLPGNISLSATYLITRGQHLPVCSDANLQPPGTPLSGGAAPPPTITYNVGQGNFKNGVSVPGGTVTVPFFTSRVNSGVGIVSACESAVHSLYNAGIFTVKKQFSHSFELLANYTVAKTQDDGQVLGASGTFNGSSDGPLNPFNQQGEWGNSDYDQRQRFVSSLLWSPSAKIGNSVANYLLNGFSFGGIVTVSSPLPVNALLTSATIPSFTLNGVRYSGVNAGVTGAVEINASISAGRAPNFPKNSFRGPTQVRDVDFRITRDIKMWKERYKMQIIAEAFNLFNHTIITDVNAPAYSFAANGTSSCPSATFTNGFPCLVPQSSFLGTVATSNGLVGARQMQFSAKLNF